MTNDPLGLFDEDTTTGDPLGLFEEDSKRKKVDDLLSSQADTASQGLQGAVEAGVGMLSGLPSQIAGGIHGLSTLAAGQGLDKAAENVQKLQEGNFGLGKYVPPSEAGKASEKRLGEAMEAPINAAGKLGFKMGGNLGETNARIAAEVLMNLVDPALAIKAIKTIKPGTKVPEAVAEAPKVEAPVVPPKDPLGLFDEQALQERLAAGDETGQMALFDQPELMGQRNQFNAGDLGDWRVDENGMPVRVDKSMDAANVEAPLQRNLFGDELPQAGLEGTNIPMTQAIDNTPANGQWAQRRGMTNRLGGNGAELLPGNDLLAAMQEANGQKLPFEESTMFDPKNPLPTKTLREMESQTALGTSTERLPPDQIPQRPDTVSTPRSPEMIAKKQELARVSEHMPEATKLVDEYNVVRTPEEAMALALKDDAKDLSRDFGRRQLSSGSNQVAAMSNNPLVKYARTVMRDARVQAENFSKQFVTSKEGISPTWAKMSKDERVGVMDALRKGDETQTFVDPNTGFTPLQKQFIESFYKGDEQLLARENANKAQAGFAPTPARAGHFPGIFKGAYKSLVMDGDKVVAVIPADTVWQRNAAAKYMKEKNPNLTIIDQKRKGLGDYKNQSDIFSGMNDVMKMLAENDPRFAEVQAMVSEAIKHGNNSLMGFNRHELSKKGVIGNEGNKPWLDAQRNADDMFKAMVQYFEEGALHHALQQPLNDIKGLANNPELAAKMPNALSYLDSYTKHATGNSTNAFGHAMDVVIDAPFKLVGIGPRVPIQYAGALKNRMSQLFMGWGNWAFTAAQLMQPMQTGLPVLQMAAGRLGMNHYSPVAMKNGLVNFMRAGLEDISGKKMDLPDHMREAYQYAKDRGLLNFSEMERAYEGTKSKFGRGFDKAAEINMKLGEVGTRTPMFMSFVDLLNKAGIENKYALPIAENMVQHSMIDYHQFERPQLYGKLGVVGQFAGGLTTFKHGYMGQQLKLAKEAPRNPIPLAQSAAAAVALAGISGLPFYDELDNLFGEITDKFFDKRQNIRDTFLKNAPEWAKSGALASATDLAMQGKFSSANMVPDSLLKAASPQLEAAGRIIGDAIDLAKNHDDQAFRNLMLSIAPSGAKGFVEDKLSRKDVIDPTTGKTKSFLLGREGLPVVERTEKDWNVRKWTGMRTNKEALGREETYRNRQEMKADEDAKKKIGLEFKRKIVNDGLTPEEASRISKEYIKRKGDPVSLLNSVGQTAMTKQLTEKQRLEGIPKNESSVQKYQYYNKPGER